MQQQNILTLRQLLKDQVNLTRKVKSYTDWKYNGFEELVLDCGTEMEATSLPKNMERGKPKNCYFNCQQLLKLHSGLTYCEGYALSNTIVIPLAHAWLISPEGKAIDPTWETPSSAYLGVAFSTKWIRAFLKSRQQKSRNNDLSIFECNYLEDFSFLKQGLPLEAYLNRE
jgi:hypothetical protein